MGVRASLTVVLGAAALSPLAHAQSAASVSGQAMDAHGAPLRHAVVRLVADPASHGGAWRYTMMGDALGKFDQEGLAPGTYLVMLSTDGQATDVLETVQLRAGEALRLELRPGRRSGAQVATSNATASLMAARR